MQKPSRNYPKRGEIFIADLNPGFGREMHKKRPILIISSDTINRDSDLVIMIPLSSIIPYVIGPQMVTIPKNFGLDKQSIIIVDQIRSIDKERLIKKLGTITKEKLSEVEDAIKLVLGLEPLD